MAKHPNPDEYTVARSTIFWVYRADDAPDPTYAEDESFEQWQESARAALEAELGPGVVVVCDHDSLKGYVFCDECGHFVGDPQATS